MLTHLLVLIEAQQAETQIDHTGVGKESNSLSRAAHVGGCVVFLVGRQGICHALQDLLRAQRIICHGVVATVCLDWGFGCVSKNGCTLEYGGDVKVEIIFKDGAGVVE